jgi:hypothetical protein
MGRVSLEELNLLELVKNVSSSFGTLRFINVFTRDRHRSLSEPDESSSHTPNLFP